MWPAHIAEFYALLGGGLRDANWDGWARPVARLAILPGHTHYDIFFLPDLLTRSSRSWKLPRWTRPRRSASKAVSVRAGRTAVRSTAEAGRTRAGGRTRATLETR